MTTVKVRKDVMPDIVDDPADPIIGFIVVRASARVTIFISHMVEQPPAQQWLLDRIKDGENDMRGVFKSRLS